MEKLLKFFGCVLVVDGVLFSVQCFPRSQQSIIKSIPPHHTHTQVLLISLWSVQCCVSSLNPTLYKILSHLFRVDTILHSIPSITWNFPSKWPLHQKTDSNILLAQFKVLQCFRKVFHWLFYYIAMYIQTHKNKDLV